MEELAFAVGKHFPVDLAAEIHVVADAVALESMPVLAGNANDRRVGSCTKVPTSPCRKYFEPSGDGEEYRNWELQGERGSIQPNGFLS